MDITNPETNVICPCCGRRVQLAYIYRPAGALFKCPECGLSTDEYMEPIKAFEAWKNREYANWTESAKKFYKKKS